MTVERQSLLVILLRRVLTTCGMRATPAPGVILLNFVCPIYNAVLPRSCGDYDDEAVHSVYVGKNRFNFVVDAALALTPHFRRDADCAMPLALSIERNNLTPDAWHIYQA